MTESKRILFIIGNNFSGISQKISRKYVESKHINLFYHNCDKAIDYIKHNMPGGSYVVFIFGFPDNYEELSKVVKKVSKKNKVFIYTDEEPFEMVSVDGFILKHEINQDLPYLMSFAK